MPLVLIDGRVYAVNERERVTEIDFPSRLMEMSFFCCFVNTFASKKLSLSLRCSVIIIQNIKKFKEGILLSICISCNSYISKSAEKVTGEVCTLQLLSLEMREKRKARGCRSGFPKRARRLLAPSFL